MTTMPVLRLLLMIILAFAGEVATPLVPEAFTVEDAEEAAHRAPHRPRLAAVHREASGPAMAQQVTVRRAVADRRQTVGRPERHGAERLKVPSAVPESSSPEAH